MKQYLIILIGITLLSGCSSSYHIKKAKQKCPECFITDTTINEIVFKLDTVIKIDTNILIFLPADTVRIDTIIKKLKPYSFKPIYSKNGIINIKVSMTRGILKVSSHLDSAIWYHYQDEILIRDALITKLITKNTKQTVVITKQKTKLKTALNWLKWIGIVLGSLFILAIIYKLYKWIKN